MDPTLVAPGVWRVTTPLSSRPRSVHAYVAEAGGGGLVLVDGGADTDDAWSALDGAIRRLPGGWEAVTLHVVTHMHTDHIGLVERVREACGAPLVMGRLDAERAAHARTHPDEEAEYRVRMLTEGGADRELVARAGGAGAGAQRPLRCDYPIPEEGGRLPGAGEWEAVWTPGHTAGHISIFRASDRVLIGGDAVLPRISATIGVNRQRPDPVQDHLEALDRLAALEISLLLPGHGDPIVAPGERIARLRAETTAETERVAELLAAGSASAAAIADARYAGRSLPPAMRILAIRETRAHLDHLVRHGRARAERVADEVRFSHLSAAERTPPACRG